MHLVMKFKTANGYYASPASYRASRIVAKFSKRWLDGSLTPPPLWQWQTAPVLTAFQEKLLRHVAACDLPHDLSRVGHRLTEEESPFSTYDDNLLCMGALTTDFRSEMVNKRTGKKARPW